METLHGGTADDEEDDARRGEPSREIDILRRDKSSRPLHKRQTRLAFP
jgi:hypothetical protein